MPVTKYFAKVWSSPKQKEQILFRVDPTTQRPLRICFRTPPPSVSNILLSFTNENQEGLTLTFNDTISEDVTIVFYDDKGSSFETVEIITSNVNIVNTSSVLGGLSWYAILTFSSGKIIQSNTVSLTN